MVKQERAARTRESLIRAAAEAFAQEGFAVASLATISRRAGVSNGALHFHFENKKALAQAVEDEAAQAMRRVTRVATQGESSALQTLVDVTHHLMGALAGDIVVRAGFELGGDQSRGNGATLRQEWQRWIEETLRWAEREGSLADGVSAQRATQTIVAATVGFVVLGCEDAKWLSERNITGFWELMLPLLTARQVMPAGSGAPARGNGSHQVQETN
ncbi:ScbR family autoregulator-binding transcription factor [Streptomyces hypolithicus]